MGSSLKNNKILITREENQAHVFVKQVREFNGVPIVAPLLKIDTYRGNKNKSILSSIDYFEWVFFTSVNGVNHFFKQLKNRESLTSCRFAVVGHKTEEALNHYGFFAEFMPTTYNAETMAREFIHKYKHVKNVLFVRGNLSRTHLLSEFSKHNIVYEKVTVYETTANQPIKSKLIQYINEDFDFFTFTSPSTIKAFFEIIGDKNIDSLLNKPCFCIGTTTEQTAQKYGFQKTYIPEVFTIESMIDKMVEYVHLEG